MKKKLTAFILSLLMMCIAVAPEMIASAEEQDSGLRLNKTATVNGDGTYKITLEAYATGSTITSLVEKPTDIILVLDTSTSMECCIVCGKKNSSTHSYAEVVSIDEGKTYYIRGDYNSYTEVKYCSGTHESGSGATTQCAGGAGWYIRTDASSHTEANKITPKTAATPNGTQFYTGSSEKCTSRIDALKTAANGFVDAVYEKTKGADKEADTDDDVDHRIAIIRFNSSAKRLTGSGDNVSALLSVKNFQSTLKNAIMNQLDMSRGTVPASGITIANSIFGSYTDTNRNRVMVVFTDGAPGAQEWKSSDSDTAANNAINAAYTTKDTHKATVYTIGIFAGADASGTIPDYVTNVKDDAERVANCNRFMYLMSSQYPKAGNMSSTGTAGNKGYYLSAGTADALNEIFQKISQTTGGSTSTLDSNAVVKDIISPQFTLPAGTTATDITLETYACTGKEGNEYIWSKNANAMGATATVNGDKVNVTGFNFSENYVGTVTTNGNTTYRGNKLVISFMVQPKAGFLGGNDVFTNTSAGIYENEKAEKPLLNFEKPTVNVPIKNVTVTAEDKNVYLLGAVTADQLKNDATVKVGDVELDLSKATDTDKPYGLEPWQTAYVDITVEVKDKDKDGNAISGKLENLTGDTTYTVEVTVSPKTNSEKAEGDAATEKSGNDEGKINVFKPELTFKDSTVEYKKSVLNKTSYTTLNDYFENVNRASVDNKKVVWKHNGATLPTGQTMTGDEPVLTLTYEPESGKIVDNNNIVESTTDIPVKVEAKIGTADVTGNTTFVHQDCTPACSWDNSKTDGDPAFLLHVINVVGDLKITKTGLNVGTYTGDKEDQESAIFEVTAEDGTKWTVAINANANGAGSVTLTGLKVGNYTVTELTNWTWRYGSSTLSSDNKNSNGTFKVNGGQTTTVTCTNDDHNDKWLGGDNYANNVFGSGN